MESEDATETEALLSAAEQGQAGTGKFFYFTTFVQAALIVHELHLLDLASLRQVTLCIIINIIVKNLWFLMHLTVLLRTLGLCFFVSLCTSVTFGLYFCAFWAKMNLFVKEALPVCCAKLMRFSLFKRLHLTC